MFSKKTIITVPASQASGASASQSQNMGHVVLATRVEYRVFGLLIYKKELVPPSPAGLTDYIYHTEI